MVSNIFNPGSKPSRSEAIRRLVEIGQKAKPK